MSIGIICMIQERKSSPTTENICASLGSQHTGYIGFDLNCTTVDACVDGKGECDAAGGYTGFANPRTCVTNGSTFAFSGCSKTNGIPS